MSAIRVANLPSSLDASRIQDLFSSAGTIVAIDTQDLGKSGAVEVFFSEPDSAQAALVLHNIEFMGQTLFVSLLEGKQPPATPLGVPPPPLPPPPGTSHGDDDEVYDPASVGPPQTVKEAIDLVNQFAKPLDRHRAMNEEKSSELQEELSRTVYVGNLNPLIQEDNIRTFFQTCGPVRYIKVLGNSQQHSSRYAFVEFDTAEGAQASFGLNGRILIDRAAKIGPASNPIFKPSNARRPVGTASQSTEVRFDSDLGLQKAREAAAALTAKLQATIQTDGDDRRESHRDSERDRERDRERDHDRRRSSRHRRSSRRSSSGSSSRHSRSKRRSRRRRSRTPSRSRSRSRSRPRPEIARRRYRDPHEGMVWDGFQWYPKDQAGTHSTNGMPIHRPHGAAMMRPNMPTQPANSYMQGQTQQVQQQQSAIVQQAAAMAVKAQMSRFLQPNK